MAALRKGGNRRQGRVVAGDPGGRFVAFSARISAGSPLTVPVPGGFHLAVMRISFEIRELRRLEQLCLEQAEESAIPEGRAALRSLAENYAAAADALAAPEPRRSSSS